MGSEWPVLSLIDAGITLIDCVHKTPQAADDGIPYVAIPQMQDGRIHASGARLVAMEDVAEWNRKANPRPYDVILSRRCNPGETAFVPPEFQCVVGQNLVLLRSDAEKVYPPFLRWLTRSPAWREQVRRHLNVGAVFDSLKCADIPGFRLPIPPLSEQRDIASVLGALDDKIELNRRVSSTADAAAQAIFRSWFLEVGRPSFLPSRPWAGVRLGDVITVLETGSRPKGGVKGISEGVPSIGAESIVGLGVFDFTKTKYVPREFFARMRKGHVQPWDVLLYKDGGRPGEFEPHVSLTGFGYPYEECCINEHVYRLRTEPTVPQSYLYCALTSEEMMGQMRMRGTGVAIPGLNASAVRELTMALPEAATLEAFDRSVRPLLARALQASLESRTLARVRDTLLPSLLSGAISMRKTGVAHDKCRSWEGS